MTTKKQPNFNESTSFQQLRSSVDFLQTHMQLIDASLMQTIGILRVHTDREQCISEVLNLSAKKYNKLNHPTKQHNNLIRHTQNKNIEFSMIQLYNIFTFYLQNITKEMFQKDPMFIVGKAVVKKDGEDKESLTLNYAELIRLGSYENIQDQIVKKIFRGFEELRSTTRLLEKIIKDTKVNISKKVQNDALTFLEMRHLFIHSRGKVDHKYATAFGNMFNPYLKEGDDLPTLFETFSNALPKVIALCETIDKQLIANGFIDKRKFRS